MIDSVEEGTRELGEHAASLYLMPGETVRVRSLAEILATLDAEGAYEGLPFMPEMARYCGRVFTVRHRVNKTCFLASEMRRLEEVVTLDDVRCDGSAHGDCQMRCMAFWKEIWLERSAEEKADQPASEDNPGFRRLRTMKDADLYFCQATEIERASSGNLPIWEPMQYVRDLQSKTFTPAELVKSGLSVVLQKISVMIMRNGGRRDRVPGASGSDEILNLKVGDVVEVKSKQEILATLDSEGRYRGLWFTIDMFAFCGKRYRVRERIDRIINESRGEMRQLQNTVILEGGVCDRHRGCGRGMYLLWREIWLRRVQGQDLTHDSK